MNNVRKIRNGLGYSREDFATMFGFSLYKIENWERGKSNPTRSDLVLLTLLEHNPTLVESIAKRVFDRIPQETKTNG